MKAYPGIKHYASKSDYLNRVNKAAKGAIPNLEIPKTEIPKDQATISEKAKEIATEKGVTTGAKVVGEVLETTAKSVASKLEQLPSLPVKEIEPSTVNKKILESPRFINKPGVFFIEGFSWFSNDRSDGLKELADSVTGSQIFKYNQQNKIIEEILKRPKEQPIILVGHSLGGDTAVEIANELNRAKYGFRQIDLLVTLDSVGFNNDIIPQNVKKNSNFFGARGSFLNDGPNIARNNDLTTVINELREDDHTAIDDSREVQFKIYSQIGAALT